MPRQTHNLPLLIWDIDETLVYSELWPTGPCDFELFDGDYGVTKRSHVDWILRQCFQYQRQGVFHNAFWTAGTEDYADAILGRLLLTGETPDFVFGRKRITYTRFEQRGMYADTGFEHTDYVKDLRKVHKLGYDLNRVLMVDNTPSVLRRNYGNLVHIPSFTGDPNDRYLLKLLPKLLEWFAAPSVRAIEKRGWWRDPEPVLAEPAKPVRTTFRERARARSRL